MNVKRYAIVLVLAFTAGASESASKFGNTIQRLQEGHVVETSEILRLGQEGSAEERSALAPIAVKFESRSRRELRKTHPTSEAANEEFFRSIEIPVERDARKALARLGETKYFKYFVHRLSDKDGDVKLDAIKTLAYIGDRAALKHLMLLIDDEGTLEIKWNRIPYKPAPFSHAAMEAISGLMPAESKPKALGGHFSADVWRGAIKQWWRKNKSKYAAIDFGKEKAF